VSFPCLQRTRQQRRQRHRDRLGLFEGKLNRHIPSPLVDKVQPDDVPLLSDSACRQRAGLPLVPGIIAFAGGLPIMTADKAHIGGIGVSGGTADQDETRAQAGLDAANDALK
jgi:hypothetical protein